MSTKSRSSQSNYPYPSFSTGYPKPPYVSPTKYPYPYRKPSYPYSAPYGKPFKGAEFNPRVPVGSNYHCSVGWY